MNSRRTRASFQFNIRHPSGTRWHASLSPRQAPLNGLVSSTRQKLLKFPVIPWRIGPHSAVRPLGVVGKGLFSVLSTLRRPRGWFLQMSNHTTRDRVPTTYPSLEITMAFSIRAYGVHFVAFIIYWREKKNSHWRLSRVDTLPCLTVTATFCFPMRAFPSRSFNCLLPHEILLFPYLA